MKLKNIVDGHLCILSPNNSTPAFLLNSKHSLLCCHCMLQGVAGRWLALYSCSHSCSQKVCSNGKEALYFTVLLWHARVSGVLCVCWEICGGC